jgi:hypothetical protein
VAKDFLDFASALGASRHRLLFSEVSGFSLWHRLFWRRILSHERLMMGQSRLKRLENNDKIARGAGRANFRKWDS